MTHGDWGNPPQQQRTGGGFGRLIMIALAVFLVMKFMRGAPQPQAEPPQPKAERPQNEAPGGIKFPPIEAPGNARAPLPRTRPAADANADDWEMESTPARPAATSPAVKPAATKPVANGAAANGDWEMEEVKSPGSQPKPPTPPKPGAKTTEGDWEMEDVKSPPG